MITYHGHTVTSEMNLICIFTWNRQLRASCSSTYRTFFIEFIMEKSFVFPWTNGILEVLRVRVLEPHEESFSWISQITEPPCCNVGLLESTLNVPSRFPMIHSTILFTSAACCKCTWNHKDVEAIIFWGFFFTNIWYLVGSLYLMCTHLIQSHMSWK